MCAPPLSLQALRYAHRQAVNDQRFLDQVAVILDFFPSTTLLCVLPLHFSAHVSLSVLYYAVLLAISLSVVSLNIGICLASSKMAISHMHPAPTDVQTISIYPHTRTLPFPAYFISGLWAWLCVGRLLGMFLRIGQRFCMELTRDSSVANGLLLAQPHLYFFIENSHPSGGILVVTFDTCQSSLHPHCRSRYLGRTETTTQRAPSLLASSSTTPFDARLILDPVIAHTSFILPTFRFRS